MIVLRGRYEILRSRVYLPGSIIARSGILDNPSHYAYLAYIIGPIRPIRPIKELVPLVLFVPSVRSKIGERVRW